jgi:hypothetical protein
MNGKLWTSLNHLKNALSFVNQVPLPFQTAHKHLEHNQFHALCGVLMKLRT